MNVAANHEYKQTELGLIPENWEYGTLEQFWNILDCKHVTAEFFDSGYPLASIREVQGRFVDLSSPKFTSAHYYSLLTEGGRKPLPGDLILSRNATVGEVAQVAEWHPPFAMGQDVCLLRSKNSGCSTGYLQSLFQSSIVQNQINNAMVGSTFKRMNVEQIRGLIIPFPPASEQKKIADSLQEMDILISSLDQLIAKKRNIQQATMQQLLAGQCRLPGFSGAWEVKPMRALGNTYGGLAGKTKNDFGHGEARYIPFMNVMTDTVIDASWLEPVDVAPDEAQNLAKKGDLFFNGSSETPEEVGFCSVLLEEIPNLYLNSFCFGFRFNAAAKVNGLFFAYWFRSKAGRAAMAVLAQGATRYNIAKSAFLQLEIPQPSEEEQTAIASILTDMGTEVAALEARRDKARLLKQGMMQELLTGRIRLV